MSDSGDIRDIPLTERKHQHGNLHRFGEALDAPAAVSGFRQGGLGALGTSDAPARSDHIHETRQSDAGRSAWALVAQDGIDLNISFSFTFSSIPAFVATVEYLGTARVTCRIKEIDTDSVVVTIFTADGASVSVAGTLNWIALER